MDRTEKEAVAHFQVPYPNQQSASTPQMDAHRWKTSSFSTVFKNAIWKQFMNIERSKRKIHADPQILTDICK